VTPERRRHSATALLAVLSIAVAVLAHFAIVERFSPALGALLSLLPAAAFLLWIARRSRHRWAVAAVLAAAALAAWAEWGNLERHFPSVFLIEHAGANLLLAIVFGRTLAAGREPLCTRFARLVHGTMTPELAVYSRAVTLAWTVFFSVLALASTVLYFGGFLTAWSVLVTMLSPVLVALMFVVEYAIRVRALPNVERTGVLGGIRAFSRHFAAAPR
jgi:uncharacterized membrane protein